MIKFITLITLNSIGIIISIFWFLTKDFSPESTTVFIAFIINLIILIPSQSIFKQTLGKNIKSKKGKIIFENNEQKSSTNTDDSNQEMGINIEGDTIKFKNNKQS